MQSFLRRYVRYELAGLCVLAAILLPILLNQKQKLCACGDAKSEAKTYIGSMSRAQQAYQIEYATFTEDLASLETGLNLQKKINAGQVFYESPNYGYQIKVQEQAAFQFGRSLSPELPSIVSGVFITEKQETTQMEVILCEASQSGTDIAAPLDSKTCAPGSSRIN